MARQHFHEFTVKGGKTMTGKDELLNFKKMWTWLCGYPAHDREYYMKHVIKLERPWVNSCPLSNDSEEKACDGCKILWNSEMGTLCTDPSSPVNKWKVSERHYPDDRSFYASQVAVLAQRSIRGRPATFVLRKSGYSTGSENPS
jgi:hypothetical protein